MIFVNVEQAINFHDEIITIHGGARGIRDLGLLISAIEMPKAMMFGEYLHVKLYEKAAAYLYHIIQNHPFVDGNKRTGTTCMMVFLIANGIDFNYPDDELEKLVIDVASGKAKKPEIVDFLETKAILE